MLSSFTPNLERFVQLWQSRSERDPMKNAMDSPSTLGPHIHPRLIEAGTCSLNDKGTSYNASSEKTKVYPVIPSTNRPLIQIWFNCLLPALPDFLSPILGGDYTAVLVRRGENDYDAKPWIQIESPRIPDLTSRKFVQAWMDNKCKDEDHVTIPVRFTEGSLHHLSGNEEYELGESFDEEENKNHHVKFSCTRPSSKPAMGASLGHLCSEKVSATLGGYVLIGDEKLMLTADHFINTSHDKADRGLGKVDELTSPSRADLKLMRLELIQDQRNLDTKKKSNYDLADDRGDQDRPTAKQAEMLVRDKSIESLLEQVTKPPREFVIGSVRWSKSEPRTASIPKSLANMVNQGIPNRGTPELTYQMDWALCELSNKNGENRHKYRSRDDAMSDDYLDDSIISSNPGEFCHTICDAEANRAVYCVGQGSLHRSGRVNLPMLVSKDFCVTHAWNILDSEQRIHQVKPKGDSGAWVISKNNNSVMGQIYAATKHGAILFTPIKVIFDELEENCHRKISLPPPLDPGPPSVPTIPLCSVTERPQPRQIRFQLPRTMPPFCSKTPVPLTAFPKNVHDGVSSQRSYQSYTETCCDSGSSSLSCGSPSSPPSLMDNSESPRTSIEFPNSSGQGALLHDINGQAEREAHPLENDEDIVGKIDECKVPYLSLDGQGEKSSVHGNRHNLNFISRKIHLGVVPAATWSHPDNDGRLQKAGLSPPVFQHQRIWTRNPRTTTCSIGPVARPRKAFSAYNLKSGLKLMGMISTSGPCSDEIGRISLLDDVYKLKNWPRSRVLA